MKQLFLALCILISGQATASDFDKCRHFFYKNEPPTDVARPKSRALCFDEFAVLHSGESKTPIYVAQALTRDNVNAQIKRTNKFFADARLPRSERAELEDYKDSGYDRGHMAPAADMATNEGMAQCFSLANMVPQNPTNNQRIWSKIEESTRKYVQRAPGTVYVMTGPVFDKSPKTIGHGHVWVPSHLFKLIHDPAANKTFAYWLDNSAEARIAKPISYDELVKRIGFKPLSVK